MGENTRSSLWQKTKNFARHFVYTNIYVESILSLEKKRKQHHSDANKKQLAFIEVKFNKEVFNMLWQYVNNQLGSKNHKYFHYENATKAKLSAT